MLYVTIDKQCKDHPNSNKFFPFYIVFDPNFSGYFELISVTE